MTTTQAARRLPIALAAAFLALLLAAPVAGAAQRFATPSGSGTLCSQAQPCDVLTAVNKANDGDEVSIAPGTYGPLSEELDDDGKSLAIHGQRGARPTILSTATYALELSGEKSSLSDVTIESDQSVYGFWVASRVRVERVYSHISTSNGIACYPLGILNDSVCWSSGENGIGATLLIAPDASATFRNSTVIASGAGGIAVRAVAFGSKMEIDLFNTIAQGTKADLFVQTNNDPKSVATIDAQYSNYAKVENINGGAGSTSAATPAGTGTNVTTAPVFVDAANGNFEQSYLSTGTIDRGETSPLNGAFDLNGGPRTLPGSYGCGNPAPAATTDIGAYELLSPTPMCAPKAAPAGKVKITKATTNRKKGKLTFVFSSDSAQGGYECRLQKLKPKKKKATKGSAAKKGKKPAFKSCTSPKSYGGKKPGRYRFEARAVGSEGISGPAAARTVRLKAPKS